MSAPGCPYEGVGFAGSSVFHRPSASLRRAASSSTAPGVVRQCSDIIGWLVAIPRRSLPLDQPRIGSSGLSPDRAGWQRSPRARQNRPSPACLFNGSRDRCSIEWVIEEVVKMLQYLCDLFVALCILNVNLLQSSPIFHPRCSMLLHHGMQSKRNWLKLPDISRCVQGCC